MFEELSLKEAVLRFPALLKVLPPEMIRDENYICRFNGEKIEIGYRDDEWHFQHQS